MGTIVSLGVVCGGVFLVMYPGFLLLERTLITNYYADRLREWRMLAARQALYEYQMVCTINAVRKALGMHSLDLNPVLSQTTDWKWLDVMRDARTSVEKPINEVLAWLRK